MALNAASNAAQSALGDRPTAQTRAYEPATSPSTAPESAPSSSSEPTTMRALTWQGKHRVQLKTVPRPTVTDPHDIVIKTTATTICGSDLHLYGGDILQLKQDDILGHEGMGVVVEAGPEVKSVKVGDRVVLSFTVSCGQCKYCKMGLNSMCSETNSSSVMEKLYGRPFAGLLGYGHFTGGMAGCQAEYVRMPFADYNTLKIPADLPDEKVFMLTDIAATSYHAVVDVQFAKGETAAVWGAGPVGQLVCQWLQVMGAKRIVLIDNVQSRLDHAERTLNGDQSRAQIELLNFDSKDDCPDGVVARLQKLEPLGWDVCFDVAGFRYAKSLVHKIARAVALETDTPETLNECILAVRKFGRISIPADYAGLCNGFNIGAVMEKGIMLKGSGQAPVQRYFKEILEQYIVPGKFDATKVLTHRFKIDDFEHLYAAFNEKRFDEHKGAPLLKCFVETKHSSPPAPGMPTVSKVPGS